MKKYTKITSFIILFYFILAIIFFNVSFAQVAVDTAFEEGSSLVPCGTEKTPLVTETDSTGKTTQTGGEVVNPCTFDHVLVLISGIVNFLLFYLAVPIATIMFAYAGFLLLFSGGESSKRTKAKSIFLNVVIGLVLAAAAWLIVNTILTIVGYNGSWNPFS